MTATSFQLQLAAPSAVLSDGLTTVPLWAVTALSLEESYILPPIGSSAAKAVVADHDDVVTLSGVLVGPQRAQHKLALEGLAEAGVRGSVLNAVTSGRVTGLVLVTALTIRADMQVRNLSFSVSPARRDVIDVGLTLAHMPPPGGLGRLLDLTSLGVAALSDWEAAR